MGSKERTFGLAFIALLAGLGAIDAVRHGIALSENPMRREDRVGKDSAGGIMGNWKSGLDVRRVETGDLARVGRLLPFARKYDMRIVTDAFGYWNSGFDTSAHYGAVFLGDCMLRGNPGEMLHERFSRESGIEAYNYSEMPAKAFLADSRFKARAPRLLVVERVERGIETWWIRSLMADYSIPPPAGGPPPDLRKRIGWLRSRIRTGRERLARNLDVMSHSWLKEGLQWGLSSARFRLLGDLPARVPLQAPDLGMLFFHEEVSSHARTPGERGLPEVLDSLAVLNRLCKDRGIVLAVLVVPDKYTIYGERVPDRPASLGDEFRSQFFRGLEDRGILALDLFPTFSARARRLDTLLYPTDDTRWTLPARDLAAKELWRQAQGIFAPSTAGAGGR